MQREIRKGYKFPKGPTARQRVHCSGLAPAHHGAASGQHVIDTRGARGRGLGAYAEASSFSVRYSSMCSDFQLVIDTSSSVCPDSSCMKRFGGAPCV